MNITITVKNDFYTLIASLILWVTMVILPFVWRKLPFSIGARLTPILVMFCSRLRGQFLDKINDSP